MWISVKETFIQERESTINNQRCPSGKVLLHLIRRDVRVSLFLFPKKVVEVTCLDTNKKIPKAHWTPEIKGKAKAMKANLTVPTWGYWSFGLILLIVFIGVPLGFLMEVKNVEKAQSQFINQTAQEKRETLKTLDTGDLLATWNAVYKISSVDEENIALLKSSIPVNPENFVEGLNNEDYPETSFSNTQLIVSKSELYNFRISPSEMILAVHDN